VTTRYLLHHGQVVDGSGAPAYRADVVIEGDRIIQLGPNLSQSLSQSAHLTQPTIMIDCRGKTIAPGFIDVHTHDDAMLLTNPGMLPKLSQGITTVITGNCGISLLPLITDTPVPPLNLLGKESFRFANIAQYTAAFAAQRPALNAAVLIGHTSLRAVAMSDLSKAATDQEVAVMSTLLDGLLTEGAIGMSSGLFYNSAFAANAQEVLTLAKVVARHGGVYTSHLRTEMAGILEAMQEAGDCAKQAGVPLVISHHKCAGPANWGRSRETLARLEQLAQGQQLAIDAYPYTAGSTVLREDLVDDVIDIQVTWSEPYPAMGGRWLAEIAREWQVSQREACRRLQPGGACYFQMHEEDVERIVSHPLTMIGSDGLPHDSHPHPRLWGAFPRVLSHYCRERQVLSLEQAIHKMTGKSAKQFKLKDRGLVQVGGFADLVVFDATTVKDLATYDHPALAAQGIEQVFVNGALSYSQNAVGQQLSAQRQGRLLLQTP
jgi:N-acyl-D-amino-acid deacylase